MKILSSIKSFCLHPIWHYSPLKIASLVKSDWNDEIIPKSEYDRVIRQHAELAAGKVTIRDIAIQNGAMTIEATDNLVGVMAEQFYARLQAEPKAENYIEFGFKPKGHSEETVTVTIQRNEGKTPHQLRMELEALIDHMAIHNAYRHCGYNQMTTEQKKLYCKIIGAEFDLMNPHFEEGGAA